MSERDAEIAMSPGVRWGAALLPGDTITREDIHNVTSMTYGQVYRTEMTGETIHTILEDVADNLFNPDPYYQQGGDMVRIGGMGFSIDIAKPIGSRITDMVHLKTGDAIDRAKTYTVAAGAASTKARRPADLGCGRSAHPQDRHRQSGTQHLGQGDRDLMIKERSPMTVESDNPPAAAPFCAARPPRARGSSPPPPPRAQARPTR
jgi:hypothetical protein